MNLIYIILKDKNLTTQKYIPNLDGICKKGHTILTHNELLNRIDFNVVGNKISLKTYYIFHLENINNLEQIKFKLLPLCNIKQVNRLEWKSRNGLQIRQSHNNIVCVNEFILDGDTLNIVDQQKIFLKNNSLWVYNNENNYYNNNNCCNRQIIIKNKYYSVLFRDNQIFNFKFIDTNSNEYIYCDEDKHHKRIDVYKQYFPNLIECYQLSLIVNIKNIVIALLFCYKHSLLNILPKDCLTLILFYYLNFY